MAGKAFLHFVKYFIGIDNAHTQTSVAERECLVKYVSGKKRILEIGVYEGATTKILADNMLPKGKLFAVDPFIPGRLGVCWGRYVARREIKKSSGWHNVQFIEKYSHEAAGIIDGEFDLVFIDGDHSLEGITCDWADWSGRVVAGGLLALHDTQVPAYNAKVKDLGSYKYFKSHIQSDQRFEIVEQVDSMSVLRRK